MIAICHEARLLSSPERKLIRGDEEEDDKKGQREMVHVSVKSKEKKKGE